MFQSAPAIIWQGNELFPSSGAVSDCFNPPLPLFGRGTKVTPFSVAAAGEFQSAPAIIWQGNSGISTASAGMFLCFNPPLPLFGRGTRHFVNFWFPSKSFNPPLPLFGRGTTQ